MFQFFANIFGYLLDIINQFVNNYGLAIILFTAIIKLIMLPLSIKQQRSMKKNVELQEKLKVIQFKYKKDPEKLNKETMDLYKQEKMSPFSGCFSAIIQFILLISIFYMVRFPLTYMEKVDKTQIDTYTQQIKDAGMDVSQAYSEIDIIREIDFLRENNPEDETLKNININMNFLGLDLSKIPQQNLADWTVYIIPILYILSTFVSMRLTTSMQNANKDKKELTDGENKETERNEMEDAMAQSNKMMSWMMPIMSVSISLVAPLGLALYWLVTNILMIGENIIFILFFMERDGKMEKSIISEGKTTNEAIEKGLKILNVSKNKVDIKVLENEEKRSFFSILTPRVVKVQLTLKDVEEEHKIVKKEINLSQEEQDIAVKNVEEFLKEFLNKLEKDEKIEYSIKADKSGVYVNINDKNLGYLIGYRGETLYALQNVLSAIAGKKIENKVRVFLDIESYRAKREKTLEELAEKISKTVIKTKKSITLEPMQAYERKIIHSKLQNNELVTTKSIGEEPRRRVVISLKNK